MFCLKHLYLFVNLVLSELEVDKRLYVGTLYLRYEYYQCDKEEQLNRKGCTCNSPLGYTMYFAGKEVQCKA